MTDVDTIPAVGERPAPIAWPAVIDTLLHYVAGAGLLAGAYFGAEAGLLDKSVFGMLLLGAAAAVGFKMSK